MIKFSIILKQSLSHDQDRNFTILLDDNIFGITIDSNIRHIGFGEYLDDLFESMTIGIGFEDREKRSLRLKRLKIR